MMQGDSYSLGFTVLNNSGSPVTPGDIMDMEICIGHIRKTYQKNQLLFDSGRWYFPISQAESFGCWPNYVNTQIRIMWGNGVVEGKKINGVRINESLSKEVL